jgi:hypothetical protein
MGELEGHQLGLTTADLVRLIDRRALARRIVVRSQLIG